MDGLEHGRGAAVGIHRAVYPGIAVIAGNHPLVGQVAAGQSSDDVPENAETVVLLEVHLHLRRPRAHVIGKGQRSLPSPRRIGAAKMLKYGPHIVIRAGSGGCFWQLYRVLWS